MNLTEKLLDTLASKPYTNADQLAMFHQQGQIDHWRRRATEAEELHDQLLDALRQIGSARTLNEARWLAAVALPTGPLPTSTTVARQPREAA